MSHLKSISAPFALAIAALAVTSGCRHAPPETKPEAGPPAVQVVKPQRQNIDCTVEQPGFVNAFEQTSIYSKVSGFIKKYYVDIGDEVHRGQLLADIFVPELKEQNDQMVKQVELDRQLVVVAQSSIQNAVAELTQAKADVGKYEADIVRSQSIVDRLTRMVREKVIDKDDLTEAQRQLASSVAAKKAAEAAVNAREADRLMAEANLGKAKLQVQVAQAEARKSKALLDYTQITAPYDGIVTVRNANTGDYVQAASGDKSTMNPSALFVIEDRDTLRVFLPVPEQYAAYIQPGKTKAAVRADALSGMEIPATVTRTSWAIRADTRSLWTEIDLTKKEYDGLRSGRYVTVDVYIHRSDVYALPQQALTVQGNQTYCYLVIDGKAVKTPVDAGISDGKWVEVRKMKIDDPWVTVNGNEKVIVGDLSDLTDGEAVKPAAPPAAKVQ